MKRGLIVLISTVLTLFIWGSVIQRASSADAISGATKHSKPKVVPVTNTALPDSVGQTEPELTIVTQDFPSSLDPTDGNNGHFTLSYGIGETLVFLDNRANVRSWLAVSWENIDPFTWKIQLKSGVKYQNGADMTAESVKKSLERAVEKNDDAAKLLQLSDIQADGLLLTIFTSEPCPELMNCLADPAFVIVDTESEDKDFSYFPICTGPFIPARFTGNTEILLSRFDKYHGGTPILKSAAIRYAADSDELSDKLALGTADAAVDVPEESLQALSDQGYSVQRSYTPSSDILFLNTEQTALSDQQVRQAFAMAADRYGASGVFAPWLPFSDNADPYFYDIQKAKALLSDAGYADNDGDGFVEKDGVKLSLRLAVPSGEAVLLEEAQTLQTQLGQLGADIGLKSYREIFFTSRARYGKFDMLLMTAQTTQNGSAQIFFEDCVTLNGNLNYGHYFNEQAESAIHSLETEYDTQNRLLLVDRIQSIVLKDAVFLVLGYPQTNIVSTHMIPGLSVHPIYGFLLTAETAAGH